MKRLRLGAVLHFLIAIGHVGCLFALDEAFEAYGIREIMHQMVSGHVWMLYALTIGLVLAFCLAGLYALSATGDIRRLPLTRMAIITIVVLYSLRALDMCMSCGGYQVKESTVRNNHYLNISLRYTYNAQKSKYKGTGAGQAERERM